MPTAEAEFWIFTGVKIFSGVEVPIYHSDLDSFDSLETADFVHVGDGLGRRVYAIAQVVDRLEVSDFDRSLERSAIAHHYSGDLTVFAICGDGYDLETSAQVAVLIAPENRSEDADEPHSPLMSSAAVAVLRRG